FFFGRRRQGNLGPLIVPAQGLDRPQVGFQDLDVEERLLAAGRGFFAVGPDGDRAPMRRRRREREPGPVDRSEEHTSELQSRETLHSFPTRRSSDLSSSGGGGRGTSGR